MPGIRLAAVFPTKKKKKKRKKVSNYERTFCVTLITCLFSIHQPLSPSLSSPSSPRIHALIVYPSLGIISVIIGAKIEERRVAQFNDRVVSFLETRLLILIK